jgi:ABC-type Fe3+/spermidine/putrescine transport system ATPase subunit
MNEVLRVHHLGQAFHGTNVLHDATFSLEAGERIAVLGPSGSGKTTLIRLIAGLEAPAHGDISIAGCAASRAGEVLIPPEQREVALVFQGLALFPHLRALEQIAFAARGRGGIAHARELLESIGLGHRANAPLDQLSGGERQRIALARALAQKPKLLLMDEPFASLDDEKRGEMRDLLRSLLDQTETTLMLVTHSREDALDLARRVLVLEKGRQVMCGPLEAALLNPRHVAVVRSLGLGQIIAAERSASGEAMTAFGSVKVNAGTGQNRLRLLVRPGQPRIVANPDGVEAEVVSLELRSSEVREVRRIAVVRVKNELLRVFAREHNVSVGQKIRVRIEGECELLAE